MCVFACVCVCVCVCAIGYVYAWCVWGDCGVRCSVCVVVYVVYGEVCMVRVRLCMCGGMSVSDPFVTSRAVARQAPLSMGFPRQEH